MDHASRGQDNRTSKEQVEGKENRGRDMGFISLNFTQCFLCHRKILSRGVV